MMLAFTMLSSLVDRKDRKKVFLSHLFEIFQGHRFSMHKFLNNF